MPKSLRFIVLSIRVLFATLSIYALGMASLPTKCLAALQPDDVADLLVVALTKTSSSKSDRVVTAHYETEKDGDIILSWSESEGDSHEDFQLIVSELDEISVASATGVYLVKISVKDSASLWSYQNGQRQGYTSVGLGQYSQYGAFEVKRLLKTLRDSLKPDPKILPRYLEAFRPIYYKSLTPEKIKEFEAMEPDAQKVVLIVMRKLASILGSLE